MGVLGRCLLLCLVLGFVFCNSDSHETEAFEKRPNATEEHPWNRLFGVVNESWTAMVAFFSERLDPILAGFRKLVGAQTTDIAPDQNHVRGHTCGLQHGFEGRRRKRLAGALDAVHRQVPWQAEIVLLLGKRVRHVCGGTLIGDRHVLTAGHCLNSYPRSLYAVFLGNLHRINSSEDGDFYARVEKKHVHPDSKLGTSTQLPFNDIAVLKLDRKVPLGDSISPACLPRPDDRLAEGDTVTASGFGFIEELHPSKNNTRPGKFGNRLEAMPERLQIGELKIVSPSSCAAFHASRDQILYSQYLCAESASENGTAICNGDSGGPLTSVFRDGRHYVFGVASWSLQVTGCRNGGKSAFTDVSKYVDWIKDVMNSTS